jgi:hypothetical protein
MDSTYSTNDTLRNIKVRKSESTGLIWGPAGRWDHNISMGLGEMMFGGVGWM